MSNFTPTYPAEAIWLPERKARRAHRRWANARATIRRVQIAAARAGQGGAR
jgi:hypothetical protein